VDRGLNEAFVPTRQQQQQQTKSQKHQQNLNTINPMAINKENNKPTSRFFELGKTTDHRQSTGQIQGTVFMVQSTPLYRLQFVRIKPVSTIENDA